jgi:stage IV sporulation protein A
MKSIRDLSCRVSKFDDVDKCLECSNNIKKLSLDAGCGKGDFEIPLSKEEYFSALSELSGVKLTTDKELFFSVVEMAKVKAEYDRMKSAIIEARSNGYGIVMPTKGELVLSEPEVVKQNGSYGVKISASAESLHMIKTEIKADICPTFGTEEQANEVVNNMTKEYLDDPTQLLDTEIFGRSVFELVSDGMHAKLAHMPDESRQKMGGTIEKIINEGASGLICILV